MIDKISTLWIATHSEKLFNQSVEQCLQISGDSEERLTSGTSSNKVAVGRSIGVWHPAYEASEDLIVSDKYEVDIFLVTFPNASSPEHEEEHFYDTLDGMNAISNK